VSLDKTPILKLNLPLFDSSPWDEDVNNNFSTLDGALAQLITVPNLAGVWQTSTAYLAGQSVYDPADSSAWLCLVSHTSGSGTFADDRVANPTYWSQTSATPSYWATQAANSAVDAANSASSAATSAAVVEGALPLSGGTMTGPIVLDADPTVALHAATKQYVDAHVGGVGYLPTTGGTMTGAIVLPGNPSAALEAAPKQYVDTMLSLGGGTLTGNLSSTGFVIGTTLSPSVGSNYVSAKAFGLNAYLDGSSVWRAVNNGYSGAISVDGSGNVQLYVGTTATAGGVTTLSQVLTLAQGVDAGFHGGCSFSNDGNFYMKKISGKPAINFSSSAYAFIFDSSVNNLYFNAGGATTWWYSRASDWQWSNVLGTVAGNGAYVNLSDASLKENVNPLPYGLDAIMAMNPVEFDRIGKSGRDAGFIAQDMQKVYPHAVVDAHEGMLGIKESNILAIAVKAIQQLTDRVKELEAKVGS
jgi:hypothetical protein